MTPIDPSLLPHVLGGIGSGPTPWITDLSWTVLTFPAVPMGAVVPASTTPNI